MKSLRQTAGIILCLATLMLIGCTRKDNLTGNDWSNLHPQVATADSFELGFSYQAEGKVKGTETRLVCGSQDLLEALAVLRFTGLPEDFEIIEAPVLKLVATRRSPLSREPLELTFHKLSQDWAADSTDLILDSNISALPVPTYPLPDSVSADGDTLEVDLDSAIIQNWETEGVTGFNLVLKALGGWAEFKSAETGGYGPLLTFKYQLAGEADTLTYSQRASRDSYRVTGEQAETLASAWQLKNLLPQRLYAKFQLNDNLFQDMDGNALSSEEIKRMTINKAELVLFVKDNPYYGSTACYFYPYSVKSDSVDSPMVLAASDLESIGYTFSSGTIVNKDSVAVEITSIVQAITSGDIQNRGVVIKATSEMQNYGSLGFWHYADAQSGKKPYVKIYYTIPYLK